jgi:hypothetical protein
MKSSFQTSGGAFTGTISRWKMKLTISRILTRAGENFEKEILECWTLKRRINGYCALEVTFFSKIEKKLKAKRNSLRFFFEI